MIVDPKEGLNTRELVCPRCGTSTGSVHLGAHKFAGICNVCKIFNVGLPATMSACGNCGSLDIRPSVIPPSTKLPKLCDGCLVEISAASDVVREGGVMWRCDDCGKTGTAKAGHPIALAARAKSRILAPDPCLALLSKKTCPVCLERTHNKEQ